MYPSQTKRMSQAVQACPNCEALILPPIPSLLILSATHVVIERIQNVVEVWKLFEDPIKEEKPTRSIFGKGVAAPPGGMTALVRLTMENRSRIVLGRNSMTRHTSRAPVSRQFYNSSFREPLLRTSHGDGKTVE